MAKRIKQEARVFPQGCCLGHYDGKRKECQEECDIADFCKKNKNSDAIKQIMKKDERTVLKCLGDSVD